MVFMNSEKALKLTFNLLKTKGGWFDQWKHGCTTIVA